MNSNIINVILQINVIKKGTFMKDATIIAIDLKKILTLGNSVSWMIGELFIMGKVVLSGLLHRKQLSHVLDMVNYIQSLEPK